MKQRLADYVADFLVSHGIRDVFSVVGGGAMHLNDALGHHKALNSIYCHHEQACAMAAEAYARVDNRVALVCVTTGPGATNAITGVAGAWMDSIPMLVISGQARLATTVYASGLNLRTRGIQEFDITGSVANMTKYCTLVSAPDQIRYCLEKALYLAKEGRPGPCWLDIPLDVQAAMIEPDQLIGYEPLSPQGRIDDETVQSIVEKLMHARRPLIFAGNGIRLSGAHSAFVQLVEKMRIPVVTGMGSIDAIETDSPYFIGRNGTTGDRPGNFAIQRCDVLLSLGSRLSLQQTGFNYDLWAKQAYKILNDIDPLELEKDSLHADMKVCCDVGDLIHQLDRTISQVPLPDYSVWLKKCTEWKAAYPVVQSHHYQSREISIYAFYHEMTTMLSANRSIVVSVGTSRVAGSQASIIKKGQRFYTNPSIAAMGWGLPAAIGVCIAEGRKPLVLVTGDGSLQMNLQELQTIAHHHFPITVFVMNNQGYHSIRMTQNNYFGEPLVGVGPESQDLSFPDLSKLIPAYGLKYVRIEKMADLHKQLAEILNGDAPCVCEVMLSTAQQTEPKVASRQLPDGQMASAALEDMAPFLPRDELRKALEVDE